MLILRVLAQLLVTLIAYQMPSQAFSSTQVTILQADGSFFAPGATPNYRFSFSLQSPPDGVSRVFVAVAGYSITSNVSFDFFTNLIYSSPTNIVLQFNAFGDLQVYSMTFCVMATTPSTYPYMAVDEFLITPQNLSDSNLTQSLSNTEQFPTLSSTLFFTHSNFIFIPYFSFLKCTNSNGPTGVALFLNHTVVGSSNFVLRMKIKVGGVLSLIKIAIILVDLNIVYSMNKMYHISNTTLVFHNFTGVPETSLASQVNSSFFPRLYGPIFSRNCTIAMTLNFQQNNGLSKKIMFDYSTSAGFTNISQGGDGLYASLVGFCTIDCLQSGFYNVTASQCQSCAIYINYCRSCINSTYCLNCGIHAYFDSLRSVCLCNGFWVKGGCTPIFYCLQVDPANGRCKKCGQNYTLSFTGMSCDCLMGNLGMSGICTSITGCLTAALVHGKVQCVSCNLTDNFYLSLNSTCSCKGGLTLKNQTCIPLCGDGLLYLDQACDDGNTLDGDGCSSSCIIEKYYACKNGSGTHKSECYYTNPNVKVAHSLTYKDNKDNIGIFVFTFTPAPSNLNRINFTASVNFTTRPKNQISRVSFSGSQLTVYILYEQDLENEYATLELKLDQNIILKNQYSLHFQMKSINYPLLVFSHYDEIQTLKFAAHILVVSTVLMFILGSWSHRMIGVEALNVFLLIFFTISIQQVGIFEIFSPLVQLRYLSNYGDLFQQEKETQRNVVNMLDIRSSFIENNLIIQPLYLLGLLALAGAALHCHLKPASKSLNLNIRKSCFDSYPFSFILYVFILPLSLGYFSQTFITAILSIVTIHAHSFPSDTIFLLVGLGSTAFIISLQCAHKAYTNTPYNSTQRKETVYFFVYTINLVSFVGLLVLAWSQSAILYLLALESIIYFLFLVIFRPYSSSLHSLGVILNQFTIVLWMGVLVANKVVCFSEGIKYLFISGVMIMLACVDIVTGLRIIYQLYSTGSQKKVIRQSLLIPESKMRRFRMDERDDELKISTFHQNFKQSFLKQKKRNQINDRATNIQSQLMPPSHFINQQKSPANRSRNNQEILMQMRARLRQTLIKNINDGSNEED